MGSLKRVAVLCGFTVLFAATAQAEDWQVAKDEDGIKWLERFGDPYLLSVSDKSGRIGIDYGVYGVPETFLIDKSGVIRYKHIGPVTPEALQDTILPIVRELQK